MIIQCTKALLDKIGVKENDLISPEGYEQFPNSFMAWHANFVSIDRKKAIILMNNETRYPIVIYRPTKKDFSNIKKLICDAIAQALRIEGVHEDVIETYFAKAGEISFSRTASRSAIAKMNNAFHEIEMMHEYLDEKTKIQKYISIVTGRLIQLSGARQSFYPFEKCVNVLVLFMVLTKILPVKMFWTSICIN